ncbi:MAG TPA: hypothetical protein VFK02_28610 [Kofleriaceae bacterium]|nr:hypothetical protein [Kofleriaceae bacterium]
MDKLNYQDLEDVRTADGMPPDWLEVTDVDVKRLRDDRSAIQPGDEVAFVATASFRVTQDAIAKLKETSGQSTSIYDDLIPGDELLVIGPDAELRSEKVAIDEDSVALWIAEHYAFTFLLNGREHAAFDEVGRIRVTTNSPTTHKPRLALPWIRTLNTAEIKDDYIDVDVRIGVPPPPPTPKPGVPMTAWKILATGGDTNLAAQLDIEIPTRSVHRLRGRAFRVPFEGCEDELRFSVSFADPPVNVDLKDRRRDALEDATTPALPARPAEAPRSTQAPRNRNR